MKCKTNKKMTVRIGNLVECIFKDLVPGEIYDLPESIIKSRNLIVVTEKPEVTEGKIGKKKVETKQFDNSYEKELRNINGIGKKTAKDIMILFPNRTDIENAIKSNDHLPFDDDIEKKLRSKKW